MAAGLYSAFVWGLMADSRADFQALILEAGRIPAERNTTYSRLRIKSPLEELTAEQMLQAEFA